MNNNHLIVCLTGLIILATASHGAEEQASNPQFSDYQTSAIFQGKVAALVLSTEKEKMFRTRLRQTQEQAINFAGDYVLATWGCGATCAMGAAVSHRTGAVSFLPGTVCCNNSEYKLLDYRPDSALLILTGYINEEGDYGRHYYRLQDDAFIFIESQPLALYPEQTDTQLK